MSEGFSPLHHVILANGQRLADDAAFLADEGRFASAFFLAVLGVEEVGKAILDHWHSAEPLPKAKGRTAHLQKQAAVSCLLVGAYAVREHAQVFTVPTELTDELMTRLTRKFNESDEGRLLGQVKANLLDKTKQMAVYQDTWEPGDPPNVDRFDNTDVHSVLAIFDRALMGFHDPTVMSHGRKFYEVAFLHVS
jgi:AbiV family abortive infection protein